MIEIRYEEAGITEGRSDLTNFSRAVAVRTLDSLGWKGAGVTILYCSEEKIRQLNRDFRQMDETTDVLSFPAHDSTEGINRDSAPYLGDLAISLAYTSSHATEQSRALEDEVALLVVHGILHLLGWDHDNKLNEKRMWKEQDRLLALCSDVRRPSLKLKSA